ncbi:hypothetical protein [Microbacterium sp. GCS4]|uniref:hypothetical protein n=1 Tax=Microbacterium sp. GCS4 TaxID=1692239 RepID=UPI00067F963E|nr:hypothetical protein [Microbacterium sp. GCS4]KNY04018.1 hypothetical protein AKH00_16715 [Microbacterium sp. GCS4]
MSDGTNPQDPTTDAVVPPPPPETPIPDGLIPEAPSVPEASEAAVPPPPDILPADDVIPPPPPEAQLRSSRRPTSIAAQPSGDRPAAAADDWAQPSIAPEVPTSGGYRVLSGVIFAVLILLLLGAVAVGVFLATTTSFPWSSGGAGSVLATASALLAPG